MLFPAGTTIKLHVTMAVVYTPHSPMHADKWPMEVSCSLNAVIRHQGFRTCHMQGKRLLSRWQKATICLLTSPVITTHHCYYRWVIADGHRQLTPAPAEQVHTAQTSSRSLSQGGMGSVCLFSIKLFSMLLTSSRMPRRSIFLGRVHYGGKTGAAPQATFLRPGSKRNCEEQPIGAGRTVCDVFHKLSLT